MENEELKTVKDLERDSDGLICPECLKDEGLKWWKKYNFPEDVCCTCEEMWREFFEITEEDLE